MRVNLPVTQNEYILRDDDLIVSRTDTKGRITYINPIFLRTSGFDAEDLLGKAHNVVRHPDMPPQAYADMWTDLKAGRPWSGMVKNRCKNGDFYWVRANVTPVREGGEITGYMSVRTKPAREEIIAADCSGSDRADEMIVAGHGDGRTPERSWRARKDRTEACTGTHELRKEGAAGPDQVEGRGPRADRSLIEEPGSRCQ